jgi:thymidylate synthase (FAD)
MESMSDKQVHGVLGTIIGSGHFAALEHATYTFAIEGVSRALTHQLVRHRLASYNQQSQRYVSYKDLPEFIVPPLVAANPVALELFNASNKRAFEGYLALRAAGVEAEDARYLLPNAMETKIAVTMNVRELMHFFELRCCKRAQWEIRNMAQLMFELAEPTAPYIFMDAGASCRRGPCKEGKMSCGDPYPRAPVRN